MKKPSAKNTKKLPSNFPVVLSGRAVPLGFNLAMNRYHRFVSCHSDMTRIRVWFYEYHGLYWFGFRVNGRYCNSVPFTSPSNCVSCLRSFLFSSGFVFDNSDSAESVIKAWRASFVPVPKSWRV